MAVRETVKLKQNGAKSKTAHYGLTGNRGEKECIFAKTVG